MAASLDRFSWSRADVEMLRPGGAASLIRDAHVVGSFVRRQGNWQVRVFDRCGALLCALVVESCSVTRGRAVALGSGERWIIERQGGCGCG